jgi:hypothetical protein
MLLVTKILLQRLVENTCFSFNEHEQQTCKKLFFCDYHNGH